MTSKPGVGIDFGTTYTSIAKTANLSTPGELLEDKDSKHHIASYVYYDEHENASVGEIAVDQDPACTIYDNKRFLGQHYQQIKDHIDNYPFKIIKDPRSEFVLYKLESNGKIHYKSPLQVAIDQMSHYNDIIHQRIEYDDQMGVTVTHPAYFDSKQKYFTYQSGMLLCFFFCSIYVDFQYLYVSVIAFLRKSLFLPFVLFNVDMFVFAIQQKLQDLQTYIQLMNQQQQQLVMLLITKRIMIKR